jgi:uncharacterized protein (DUF1800 family)
MNRFTARLRRAVGAGLVAVLGLGAAAEAHAGAAEQALVTHYYQSLLRRAPDAGGVAYWDSEATRLRDAGEDPAEAFLAMATQFIDSPEYRAFNRTTPAFLTDLYQAFFQRAPDAAGLAHWEAQAALGMPRGVLLSHFLFSPEFRQFITATLGNVPARPEGTTVIDFYRGYLSRLPDSAGLVFWRDQFRTAQCAGAVALATSAESISSQFQGSAEYGARARTNADFVGDLYGIFMRRGSDVAGLNYWVQQLQAGVTREAVRRQFLASPEFQARLAAIVAAGCFDGTAAAAAKRRDAARLLQQATWGATLAEIDQAAALGPEAWIEQQFAAPASIYTALAQQYIDENKLGLHGCVVGLELGCPWTVARPTFYKRAFEGGDPLRQRVSNALLQVMVVSIANNRLEDAGTAVPSYLDMLGRNAFGNFRDLLRDVTLHPAMGVYLDMLGSSLEVPNENYARELLQIFSTGTVLLNPDGTSKRDGAGREIPVYDEDTVKGFAKAFTGWHFADQDQAQVLKFYWPDARWTVPMQPWTARRCPQDYRWPAGSTIGWCNPLDPAFSYPPPHDTGTKQLLQYAGAPFATLPAGQAPQKDLEDAIENIFHHPNVGPFIGKQLIQRLVTSNPSPAYVARISAVFANNGSGVRGDMRAVVRAILLDAEARSPTVAASNTFGKLREPVAKFIHLHRAFGARPSGGFYDIPDLSDPAFLNQSPLAAPSVFNFYGRDFAPSGPLGQAGLVGPEFELATASSVTGFADFSIYAIYGGFGQYIQGLDPARWIRADYDRYLAGASPLADRPQELVDELDLLLTAGNLKGAFKAQLVTALEGVTRSAIADQRTDRLRVALWQIIHSPEYAVQR